MALLTPRVSIYRTGKNFVDLCRGPHIKSTGEIKAFKLLSVAGSLLAWDRDKSHAAEDLWHLF